MAQALNTHGFGDGAAFEAEVLRVARLLYPGDPLGGPTIIENRERDGVFVTQELAIVIEATTLMTKAKAESDGKKLKDLAAQLAKEHPYKGVKAFFVTKNEPTADQRDVIRRLGSPLVAIGYDAFRNMLIDTKSYLEVRQVHAFGSARDPETDGVAVSDKYVQLDFVDMASPKLQHDVTSLTAQVAAGRQVVIIGDFGTGKSMTLREAFLNFRKSFYGTATTTFAIHLNLSDHQGQVEPTEALLRHAQLIGFGSPHQLIRAWRSGDVHVILDGFDEIFTSGWAATTRPITDVRRRSVELVRRFSEQTPQPAGILIAGREHFFDSMKELGVALGLGKDPLVVSASEFTEEQVQTYLRNRAWNLKLPEWLPRRPLIVGYLAGRRLFDSVSEFEANDRGEGWDRLVAAICAREARIDAGLESSSIRQMLERLATLARKSASGLGPLQFQDLVTAFRDLMGYLPDEAAYSVLQRLPGLRVTDGQTNSRSFVDDDLVDAFRAGDIAAWIDSPFDPTRLDAFAGAQNLLGEVGLDLLRHRAEYQSISKGAIQTAIAKAAGRDSGVVVQADIVRLALSLGIAPSRDLSLSSIHIPTLTIGEDCDASKLTLSDVMIETLDVSDVADGAKLPHIHNSYIEVVDGAANFDNLGSERIVSCTIGSFTDSVENASSILKLDVSEQTRVALTILRKIFVQSGHSRKESALYRGPLDHVQKALIPEVLRKLEHSDVIRMVRRRDTTLWVPNRALYSRVKRVLDNPTTTDDPILIDL